MLLTATLLFACDFNNTGPGWISDYFFEDDDVSEPEPDYTGVAPFALVFSAVDMAEVVRPPLENKRREYGDFHYAWNFGDPGSGSWPHSGRPKNEDIGFTAAHVYDAPGNYTVTLTVTDNDGVTHSYTRQVTVQDQDAAFPGQNTICVSASGNFTDAPTGALQISTTNILDIEPYIQTGRRILLCRGDTWTTTGQLFIINVPGPFVLGAYGTGLDPDERGIYANAPHIIVSGSSQDGSFLEYWDVNHWTIMDLHISGDLGFNGGISGGVRECTDMLHYRLHMEGFDTPIGTTHWETDGNKLWMLIDSKIHDTNGMTVYTGAEKLVVMGNLLYHSINTHILRVWQGYKAVISHNVIHGSSLNSDSGRHALKLHGPTETLIYLPATREEHLAKRTRLATVYDNVFGTCGPWPVVIGPKDTISDERLGDILVEGNKFIAGFGTPSALSSPPQIHLRIAASYVTVRNNIFDGTDSSQYYTAVLVTEEGFIPARGNKILHNSVYKTDFSGVTPSFTVFALAAGSERSIVRNNLVRYAPAPQLESVLVADQGADTTHDHNLLTDGACFIDPTNADPLLRDFRLAPGSPAENAGITAGVFYDFNLALRGGVPDLGAFED